MTQTYLESLAKLISLHHRLGCVHPALEKCYPVAIVEGEKFLIYDLDQSQGIYHFKKSAPIPMPIPQGVRAAFQLADYGGRIACVVTPEVFDSIEGYVTILHEYVHCFQYETCEQELKMTLDIAKQAQEKGDFMWEIEHPFPYTAKAFIDAYPDFLAALRAPDFPAVSRIRQWLNMYLGRHDFEYMLWQEWKEGFARWVENRLQAHLGLDINNRGSEPPFSRITFYAGGATFIEALYRREPTAVNDLMKLFNQMSMNIGHPALSAINDENHP